MSAELVPTAAERAPDAQPGVAKSDPILVAESVQHQFGGIVAVDVDHIKVQRNEITALIGPNGAGKTTFFNLLTGFDEANHGQWYFDGEQVAGRSPHRLARIGMVRTFQLTKALARLSVMQNMRLGATGRDRRAGVGRAVVVSVGPTRRRTTPSAPTSCSSASASTTSATSSLATSPAVSANCWRWHER